MLEIFKHIQGGLLGLLGPHKVAPGPQKRQKLPFLACPKVAIFGVSGASGATFWGPLRSKLTPLDVFDNVQLCSNRAIGGAYGQKWAFSSKNGRFRSLGPPGATFWGAQRPKQTTLDVLYNVQTCPTNVQPIWICWRCLWPKMAFLDPN